MARIGMPEVSVLSLNVTPESTMPVCCVSCDLAVRIALRNPVTCCAAMTTPDAGAGRLTMPAHWMCVPPQMSYIAFNASRTCWNWLAATIVVGDQRPAAPRDHSRLT